MRKIPVTMATQHPDNAEASPFSGKAFVGAQEEIEECFRCFSELGVEEYMWDWEGKFVDEAVMDRLYSQHFDYFQKNPIGKEIFLTFRIPNIWEEKSHKLPRSFMNIVTAQQAAKNYGMHTPPLFEVILPMATRTDQLKYLQETFQKIARATSEIFGQKSDLSMIDVIPLFEEVETMADSVKILEEYVNFLQSEYNYVPEYLRVFIARSDPAMNAGLLPAMMACKHAISAYHAFGKKRGIEIYPWIGGGSLPFRGGINPENAQHIIQEFRGIASLTIQSAYRNDYPMDLVKSTIAKFNAQIPQSRKNYREISTSEGEEIKAFNLKAKQFFQKTVEQLAPNINQVAEKLPNHRERVQHIGIFGYARGVGKVTLPRAIKFTGALYSVGVPPEFIGTGRALKLAQEQGMLDLLKDLYLNLIRDLEHAGHFINRENLEMLAGREPGFSDILEDVILVEEILGIHLGPVTTRHLIHRNLASNIYHKIQLGDDDYLSEDLIRAAKIRKSLG
jgi:phosphoenolpyruvate carboxylase